MLVGPPFPIGCHPPDLLGWLHNCSFYSVCCLVWWAVIHFHHSVWQVVWVLLFLLFLRQVLDYWLVCSLFFFLCHLMGVFISGLTNASFHSSQNWFVSSDLFFMCIIAGKQPSSTCFSLSVGMISSWQVLAGIAFIIFASWLCVTGVNFLTFGISSCLSWCAGMFVNPVSYFVYFVQKEICKVFC